MHTHHISLLSFVIFHTHLPYSFYLFICSGTLSTLLASGPSLALQLQILHLLELYIPIEGPPKEEVEKGACGFRGVWALEVRFFVFEFGMDKGKDRRVERGDGERT